MSALDQLGDAVCFIEGRMRKKRIALQPDVPGYLIDRRHPAYPPQDVIDAAEKVGQWFAQHGITGWQLGPCADRFTKERK